MSLCRKALSATGGLALAATALYAAGPATAAESPPDPVPSSRQTQQEKAHEVLSALPASVKSQLAGKWIDAKSGELVVAVTSSDAAKRATAAGARPRLVGRGKAELDRLYAEVAELAGSGVPGLRSFGIDEAGNRVQVTVDRNRATPATQRFQDRIRALGNGVVLREVTTSFVQQAGDVKPGSPWWPGGESNCSIGFGATDAQGGKHFVTAGHCTNDANQPAYGQSGQQNRIGTSNVGGSRSVNAREGDMGVVAVTESGWNLSADVNTWGQPAVEVTGSADAIVGDTVCHSGNTAPNWECGTVRSVNQTVDYGGGIVVEGLTLTSACSEGGDSGGAWLRGDKAIGMHSGGQSSCSPNQDNSIFQPVGEALTKWGLTLYAATPGGDTEAPTVPGSLRPTGTTAASVSLAWDASTDDTGVTGYDVYNGDTLAKTVTGTTATVDGLAGDTAYSFSVQAKDAAGNKSAKTAPVTVRTQPGGGGGGRTFSNGTDYPIRDFEVAISAVRSTATGRAANPVTVSVTATHTCTQDLNIRVVSPTGRTYWLQQYGGYPCTAFPGAKTWTVTPAATENAAGTWTLRIGDNGPQDEGVLDSWSITV